MWILAPLVASLAYVTNMSAGLVAETMRVQHVTFSAKQTKAKLIDRKY